MRSIDLGSWQAALSTLLGVALFALVGIGIRLLLMMTVQQRRERMNRQINERLKVLIAAYKTLGGSFTGNLLVDPRHLRDFRTDDGAADPGQGWDRRRQIRDAVEAALSDILLLGTEEQVRLAGRAAQDLVAGQPVRTDELVISLRSFIRSALDLDPIPGAVSVPAQGPTRPGSTPARAKADGAKGAEGRSGGGGGMGGGGMGGGGMGSGGGDPPADDPPHR
jgi:uncharacterized membrane protein YgcG